jgi:hypothetical protein
MCYVIGNLNIYRTSHSLIPLLFLVVFKVSKILFALDSLLSRAWMANVITNVYYQNEKKN